jgi:lipopolysaccharide biosynthesis protein
MRSACFFASYFTTEQLPYYIGVYLKELRRHFTDVFFLSSKENLSPADQAFLKEQGIFYQVEKNEGFDFGLWYKAFQNTDIETYDQIALVNDSCILFKPLDKFMEWSRSNGADMQGMTYSEAIAPHLQSYFLLIHKNALRPVKDFFNRNGLIHDIKDVIRTYEVGLSGYLAGKGLTLDAYMSREGAEGEFSPYYTHVKEHLAKGIPLIKKKILFASYRKDEMFTLARMDFDVNAKGYVKLIQAKVPDLVLSFDKLFNDAPKGLNTWQRLKHKLLRGLIQIYRKLKR